MPQSLRLQARSARRFAVMCGVLAVLVGGVTGVVPGLAPDPPVAGAATVCGGSVGPDQIRVGLVVDPGPDGPGGPGAICLVVARGTTGAQLLAERAAALGVARPRYADSGLMCAVDGYPATGCGERTADGYRYWAYFSGTSGSWVYGSGNPFLRRLADGDVEGWRFVAGTGTGQDPAPRLAPTGLFPPLPPPVPVAPTPAPGAPPGVTGAVSPGSGATAPGFPAPGSPGAGAVGSAVPSGSGSSAGDTGSGAPIEGAPTDAPSPGRGTVAGEEGAAEDADAGVGELAADVAVSSSTPTGPIGAVVAGLVIAALVVATVLRSRARR